MAAGVDRIVRLVCRRRALVLAYHNILPDEAAPGGERVLHLSRANFVSQLERLLRTHQIVPLTDLLDPVKGGAARRPRVALTFDDAYRGAVLIAVDELVKRGLPATLFVAPGRLGRASFWWDRLADALPGGMSVRVRSHAIEKLRGEDERIRRWIGESGFPPQVSDEWRQTATEAELRAASRHAGITIASHSWSHVNLTALEDGELDLELVRPLQWLRERFDRVVPWLSYPYGRSTPRIQRAAERAGYHAALLLDAGLISRPLANPYALPRWNVGAAYSMRGFALRTSGLLRL